MECAIEHLMNDFDSELSSYIENIKEARAKNQHHDHRRSLFVALITKCFNLQFSEVILEQHINLKGSSIRGRIDALYEDIVFDYEEHETYLIEDQLEKLDFEDSIEEV